jgi:hypothetical protein
LAFGPVHVVHDGLQVEPQVDGAGPDNHVPAGHVVHEPVPLALHVAHDGSQTIGGGATTPEPDVDEVVTPLVF